MAWPSGRLAAIAVVAGCLCGPSSLLLAATATDWPQLLGPHRDGISAVPRLAKVWPKEGPPVVWKREVGPGFAGPAVRGERLILFHRVDDRAVVECLDPLSG